MKEESRRGQLQDSNPRRKVTQFCSLVLICILGSISAHAQVASSSHATDPYEEHAALAIQTLQTWYDLDTGLYKTTGWWNSANAITALANYAKVTQSHEYDFVF